MKPWINFKAFRVESRYWDKCLLSFVEWGRNMLTHFLMALSGGLDFCLVNVLLECISVSSSSCPASYQRPICVCSRRKMQCVCVCGQCACPPLTEFCSDRMLNAHGDGDVPWGRSHNSVFWTKNEIIFTYRICYASPFPSLFNFENKNCVILNVS